MAKIVADQPQGDGTNGGLLRLLQPYTWRLVRVVVVLAALALVNMALPYFVKLLIDDVFAQGKWNQLYLILPAILLVYVARNTLWFSSRMLALGISEDLSFSLRKRLFEHIQQFSLRFYRSHQAGQIGSRVMDDTFKIQLFIQDKFPNLLLNALMFQIALVFLTGISLRLMVVTVVILPLHFMVYRYFRQPIRHSHKEAQESLSTAYGNLVEKFLGMEVVKGFSGEERESETFHKAINASRKSQIQTQRYQFKQKVIADLLVGLSTAFLFGIGALEVKSGRMTGGDFVWFFGYVTMLYPAALAIISGSGHLSRTSASVDRIYEMLHEPVHEYVGAGKHAIAEPIQGQIDFQNVHFAYEEGHPILTGITASINAGEHVAIVGPSGSGKSTLISLLPRFNDPIEGSTLIDGIPVQKRPVRALRSGIGIAFQEVFLFKATISENLRYADPDATMPEIIEACQITGAHEFIERLPNGYSTVVGASGIELSRGEKQRITLARAVLRNPQILILDESTASIDSRSARQIIEAIVERFHDRTIIMVTHDDDLLDLMDRVLYLHAGKVDFDGTPGDYAASSLSPSEDRSNGGPAMSSTSPAPKPVTTKADAASTAQESTPPMPQTQPGLSGGVKKHKGSTLPKGTAGLALLLTSLFIGCSSIEETTSSVEMVEPRTNHGLLTSEANENGLDRLAAALDQFNQDHEPLALSATVANEDFNATPPAQTESKSLSGFPMQQELAAIAAAQTTYSHVDMSRFPTNAGALIPLPKLSSVQINEIIDQLVLKYQTEQGYSPQGASEVALELPPIPNGVKRGNTIGRLVETGTQVLRFGYRQFRSQPPQLWVWGVTFAGEAVSTNPDVAAVSSAVDATIAAINAMNAAMTGADLERKHIKLSYINPPEAILLLKGMGITTVDNPAAIPNPIDVNTLPLVTIMPGPKPDQMALIGGEATGGGAWKQSLTPNMANPLPPDVVGTPPNELLIMFHPAQPEQFSKVQALLDEVIDRPAQRVFIEGLVLEISEEGLEDLGIDWQFKEGPIDWMVGSLEAGGVVDTLTFNKFNTVDVAREWGMRLRMLVREGKAEVLSRPSILTLDNRQAAIRVGEDVPIATTQEGLAGTSNKISFNFKYLVTGILLNVRPRITRDGKEVVMLIDTIVSAPVPGRDLEIRSLDGELLASAPTVSARRVQTYARIENNTPFIIGGLVSRDHTITKDKIPFLGDLPIIGPAFRSERTETSKREVIIVLTPYVLPDNQQISRALPKDEEHFDSFDNELFRDAYRIRAEDVFDLAFLLENKRLQSYRKAAAAAIRNNFRLASVEPFSHYAGGRIPGEPILVHRMMYEVIKRLDNQKEIDPARLIFFARQQEVGGYDVEFLERFLAKRANGTTYADYFGRNPGKAIGITFYYDRDSLDADHLASEPVPEIAEYDCPNSKAWGELLWELNQPENGRERFTILLSREKDIVRLQRAIMLKKIIALNGGEDAASLTNFTVGKVLLMPEIKPDQAHVIDADVARYFFHTEHYYAAAIKAIETCLNHMDELLKRPEFQGLMATPPSAETGGE